MQSRAKNFAFALTSGVALLSLAVPGAAAGPMMTKVTFTAQNGSGETGSAMLTAMGMKTKVVVKLTGAPAGPQPAHIHLGTCTTLDPKPAYPLTALMNGTSTTIVPVTLSKLEAAHYAINVHKSVPAAATYVSCGNIASMAKSSMGGYGGGMAPMSHSSMAPMSGSSMAPMSGSSMAPMSGSSMAPMSHSSMAPVSGSSMAPRSTPSTAPSMGSMGPGSGGDTPVGPLATPGSMSTGPATQATGPASQASHSP